MTTGWRWRKVSNEWRTRVRAAEMYRDKRRGKGYGWDKSMTGFFFLLYFFSPFFTRTLARVRRTGIVCARLCMARRNYPMAKRATFRRRTMAGRLAIKYFGENSVCHHGISLSLSIRPSRTSQNFPSFRSCTACCSISPPLPPPSTVHPRSTTSSVRIYVYNIYMYTTGCGVALFIRSTKQKPLRPARSISWIVFKYSQWPWNKGHRRGVTGGMTICRIRFFFSLFPRVVLWNFYAANVPHALPTRKVYKV